MMLLAFCPNQGGSDQLLSLKHLHAPAGITRIHQKKNRRIPSLVIGIGNQLGNHLLIIRRHRHLAHLFRGQQFVIKNDLGWLPITLDRGSEYRVKLTQRTTYPKQPSHDTTNSQLHDTLLILYISTHKHDRLLMTLKRNDKQTSLQFQKARSSRLQASSIYHYFLAVDFL